MKRRQRKEQDLSRLSNYARRIHDLRIDADLSQQELADILHVGQRTYCDYERDIVRIPITALITLAEHYDVDMNYICGLSREKRHFPRE